MTKPISRNRADYPPSTHTFVQTVADAFLNGDLDAAWESFFCAVEEDAERVESARLRMSEPAHPGLKLRVTPPEQ